MKFIVLICSLCFAFNSVCAAVKSSNVIKGYEAGGEAKEITITYINGVGEGIAWTNAILKNEGRQPLFCKPSNMAFDGEGHYQLFRIEYFRNQKLYESVPPAYPLLMSLIRAYPCP